MRVMRDKAKRTRKNVTLSGASNAVPVLPKAPVGAATADTNAGNLDALRNAVADAAGVGTGLWLTYLSILAYLAIATGAVTHRDLFFDNPLKLPLLNVDLPLSVFFVLGPLLLLVVHTYVLLHLVLLAGKVGHFDTELNRQISGDDTRVSWRRQLPSNIFVQIVAGPREIRDGFIGFMLRVIISITLIIAPIGLLV